MGRKIIQTAQIVFAVAIVLAVGVFLGVQMQAEHEEGTFLVSTAQSGRIAVVNLDLGATYQDEHLHFAAGVVETLSDDFVVVSRAMADSGLANGNYAAVISFPPYFSQQITQINLVRPTPASFSYQLNPNLSQRDTIITMLRIIDLEEHVSDTVSFMYVASIMGELHDAQATADELLRNNQSDISAVHDFVNADIIPRLILSALQRSFPEINHPNFSEFVSENNRVANELGDQYRYAMDQARSAYSGVLDDMRDAINSTNAIPSAIDSATSTFSGVASRLEVLPENDDGETRLDRLLESALEASADRFEGTMELVLNIGDNLVDLIEDLELPDEDDPIADDADELWTELQNSPDILDMVEDFMDILAAVGWAEHCCNYYPNCLNYPHHPICIPSCLYYPYCLCPGPVWHYYFSPQDLDDLRDDILYIALEVSALQRSADRDSYADFFEEHLEDLVEEVEEKFGHMYLVLEAQMEAEVAMLTSMAEELEEYLINRQTTIRSTAISAQSQAASSVTTVFTDVMQRLTESNARAGQFDPTMYVAERQNELSELLFLFGDNNRDWSMEVNEAISDRTTAVFDIFSEHNEHIWQLQEDMHTVTDGAQANLDESHETLLDTMTGSNRHNNQLIGNFIGVLPNSRIGAHGNTDFFSFVVSPVGRIEVGGASQAAFAPPEISEAVPTNQMLPYIILGLSVLFVALAIVGYGVKRMRRRVDEPS